MFDPRAQFERQSRALRIECAKRKHARAMHDRAELFHRWCDGYTLTKDERFRLREARRQITEAERTLQELVDAGQPVDVDSGSDLLHQPGVGDAGGADAR